MAGAMHGRGVCVARGHAGDMHGKGPSMAGEHAWQGRACMVIQSMSGQYTSYWNAFLLHFKFLAAQHKKSNRDFHRY